MNVKIVGDTEMAVYGVARARAMQQNIDAVKDIPLEILANVIANTADDILNNNRFGLYIAERKIKK